VASISGYVPGNAAARRIEAGWPTPQILVLIRTIHDQLKGAYGSPRMVLALCARGFVASKARVERLMREHGIRARHKRKSR